MRCEIGEKKRNSKKLSSIFSRSYIKRQSGVVEFSISVMFFEVETRIGQHNHPRVKNVLDQIHSLPVLLKSSYRQIGGSNKYLNC